MPVEVPPIVARRALFELRALDPDGAVAVEGAFGWPGSDGSEDEPLLITRYDVQLFVWYQLPCKWLDTVARKLEAAESLARFLDLLGGAAREYAGICRSEDTRGLIALWQEEPRPARRRLRALLDQSGLDPPDTPVLGWGDAMGPIEAQAHRDAAHALELALEAGRITAGERGFKPARVGIVEELLSSPCAELGSGTLLDAVVAERITSWQRAGSAERRELLERIALLMSAPGPAPELAQVEAALEPLSWLLGAAAAGIALTQTGALSRAFVRGAVERYPDWFNTELFGLPHREHEVGALVALDELATAARLVRRKGRELHLTRRGAGALADLHDLLARVSDALVGRGAFAVAVRELAAAELLASGELSVRSLESRVRAVIVADGWRAGGEPASEGDIAPEVWNLTRPARLLGLLRYDGDSQTRRASLTDVGQAALREALRGRASAARG